MNRCSELRKFPQSNMSHTQLLRDVQSGTMRTGTYKNMTPLPELNAIAMRYPEKTFYLGQVFNNTTNCYKCVASRTAILVGT